jgi:DNA-binding transcriptional LysR family regulator
MLLDGVVDAGFILPGSRPPSLRFVPLAPDPVVCVCARSHQLARSKSVSVRSVLEHDVAINLWGTGANEFSDELASARASSHRVECSDTTTAIQLALDNGYLAFIAQSATRSEVAAGELKVLNVRGLPSWSVRLVLASRAKGETDSDVESLKRVVRQLSGH